MKGSYEVVVRNNRTQFKLYISRNITILRGDSSTGKTTLIDMVAAYQREGVNSGVSIVCKRPCVTLLGPDWEHQVQAYDNCIVFIDEGFRPVSSEDFARAIRNTSNYYVIAARESLFQLPYSVTEIYGIKNETKQRKQGVWRFYSSNQRLYYAESAHPHEELPELVIVEDSHAGFEFFSELSKRLGISCISTQSKSRVYREVCRCDAEKVLVIADGAAFGPEYERLYILSRMSHSKKVWIYLPESFEHLLLSSGIVKDDELPAILRDPPAFIESRENFSWEQYFTKLLVRMTHDSYLAYSKGKLNPAYLHEHEKRAITDEMEREGLKAFNVSHID